MNKQDNFIGMGPNPNPNVPDIPTGLGMALFQESAARSYFESLDDGRKTAVIRYVEDNNVTGEDAKHKVVSAIEGLKRQSTDFTGGM